MDEENRPASYSWAGLSLRINRLKFNTSGKLRIGLENVPQINEGNPKDANV